MTNVFMHTFDDVDTFFKDIYSNKIDYNLYATHAGVVEYIYDKYIQHSTLLSSLISQYEIDDINKQSYITSDIFLKELDINYSYKISEEYGIKKINFFYTLYSYTFPFIISYLKVFKEILIQLNQDIHKNIIFEYDDSFFNSSLLKQYLEADLDKSINITWYQNKTTKKITKNYFKQILFVFQNKNKVYNKIKELINKYMSYNQKNKKTILYMESLYDLRFIKESKDFQFISYDTQSIYPKFYLKNKKRYESIDLNNIIQKSNNFFETFLVNNFLKNSFNLINGLNVLDTLIDENDIKLAIWGNPPTNGFKALFYEYCMIKDIKVLGMQHGACYVDQNIPRLYYADFIRCTDYISYGFTQDDLKNNFKDKDFKNLKIFSIGTSKTISQDIKNKKKIDVLFPVTNSISMMEGGLSRVKPDILHRDQCQILDFLEQNSGISSLVKPMMNTNLWQTSIYLKLKKLKNIKVEYYKSFIDVLNQENPKCIIIEYMSTPLYEVINLDVDIFLFVRDVDHLTTKARTMLEKRAFIVKDFEEFEQIFLKWERGLLDSKRDNSYANYYIKSGNIHKNIIELLKQL